MLTEATVLLAVALEDLTLPRTDLQEQLSLVAVVALVAPLQHSGLRATPYREAVRDGEVALREGQVVQGVQQVGLPHTIEPNKAVNLRGEGAAGRRYALKVDEVKPS